MAKILHDDDKFIVNRSDVTTTVKSSELMAEIQDTDWMVVNRGDQTYKISGEDVKDSLEPNEPEVIAAPTLLTPVNDSTGLSKDGLTMTCTAFAFTAGIPTPLFGSTTWQVAKDSAFTQLIEDATTAEETSHDVIFNPPLEYSGTYYARCKHTSAEGTDSDWSVVNEFEVEADPSLPTATMYGLRFDEQRQTVMTSALGKESVNCTFSFWIKASDADGFGLLHTAISDQNTQYVFDGYGGGLTTRPIGSGPVSVPGTLTENAWNHVVISKADQDITFYLNGENKGTAQATSAGLTYFDGINPVNLTGINGSPKYNILDGYLSDAFFVDGQALDCEVFGKFFDGKWGPLDSSVVDENIKGKESPYDTRPDMSQNWTATLVADSGSVAQQGRGFDGDLATYTYTVNNNGTLIWTPTTPLTDVTKFEIYRANSGNAENNARLNGAGDFTEFPQETWTTLHDGAEITVSNLQVTGYNNNNGLLGAVRVNGRLLVDGPADNSQVWSNYTSAVGGFMSSQPATNIFNGILAENNLGQGQAAVVNEPISIDFSSLTVASTISIWSGKAQVAYQINNSGSYTTYTDAVSDFKDISFSGTLTNLKIKHGQLSQTIAVSGINIDGKLLVDAPAQWNTSQIWSDTITNSATGKKGFDGTEDNWFADDGEVSTWTGSVDYTKLRTRLTSAAGNGNWGDFKINGVSQAPTTNTKHWFTPTGIASPLTSIQIDRASQTQGAQITMVEVDGEILVDGGTFGANGFHLPV